jgi:hypothetical protein
MTRTIAASPLVAAPVDFTVKVELVLVAGVEPASELPVGVDTAATEVVW